MTKTNMAKRIQIHNRNNRNTLEHACGLMFEHLCISDLRPKGPKKFFWLNPRNRTNNIGRII